jgi:deoxyribodipyrimidine photolyase-like uncharacterized protein
MRALRGAEASASDFVSTLEKFTSQVSEQYASALIDQLPSDPVRVRKLSRNLATASNVLDEVQRALMHKPPSEIKALAPAVHGSPALLKSIKMQELLDSSNFTKRLNWTRQALSKALRANRVFFLEVRGDRYFPAFFTDPRHERRHLEVVSRMLGDVPGGGKWLFFTTPKGSLSGLTPIQALDKGQLVAVKAAAERFTQA